MKRILICILAAAALASCAKNEGEGPQAPATPDLSAPIGLSAGIQASAESKAAVTGDKFDAGTSVFNLMAMQSATAPTATSDWTAPYFTNLGVDSDASGVLSLSTPKYYPANPAQKLFFYAWAPAQDYTAGTANTPATVVYDISDGQKDIMFAKATGASDAGFDKNSAVQPALGFTHKLMQAKFVLKADATFFDPGVTEQAITSLTVKSLSPTATLDLFTGNVAFSGTPTGFSMPIAAGDKITAAGTTMAGCLMFEPKTSFVVSVVAGGVTYADATVTLSGTNPGSPGYSHTVTLTFTRSGIVPTAVITPWQPGDPADVTIQ